MGTFKARAAALPAVMCAALLGCASIPQAPLDQGFPITVDYGARIEDLTRDGGYGWVYSEINSSNFPPNASGSQPLTVRLVRLGSQYSAYSMYSMNKFLEAEKADGLRPADIRELLTFGKTYPDIQRGASVVGFGSSRTYTTITYMHFGMGPRDVETIIAHERFYPALIHGLLGRSAVLMQEDLIPDYDPGAFYGCFVEEGN